jgi:hypothetical protein
MPQVRKDTGGPESIIVIRKSFSQAASRELNSSQLIRRGFEQGDEPRLVGTLVVRLFGANPLFVQEIHDGLIQTLHAHFFARLDRRRHLSRLAFPDQIRDGRRADHDLQGGASPLLVNSFKEVLRHDDFQARG